LLKSPASRRRHGTSRAGFAPVFAWINGHDGARPSLTLYSIESVKQVGGHFAAIIRKLLQHLFVQPDVHLRGIVRIAAVMQFLRKRRPRGEAAVHSDQFHQIDNRSFPIQLFRIFRREFIQRCADVHGLRRTAAVAGPANGGLPVAGVAGFPTDATGAVGVGLVAPPKIRDMRVFSNPIDRVLILSQSDAIK